MRVGDVFLGANGELCVLADSVRVEYAENITVYNFSVDDNHNYFIIARDDEYGQTCVLVHNAQKSFYQDPLINVQQQESHVLNTAQFRNRVKQGKPTSVFPDRATAEAAVTEAKQLGKQVPNRPEVLEHDLGRIIGTDLLGNPTSVVRVHLKPSGVYHGYPF